MSRVDIAGQFNVDNAACSSAQPIRVDRRPGSLSTARIGNWNAFCDSVDKELVPLARLRSRARVASGLLYCFLAAYALFMTVGARALRLDGLPKQAVGAALLLVTFVYFLAHCRVRAGLAAVMERVKGVCQRHSGDGVNYELESEHWGRCNKPHVKRYYIEVEQVAVDAEREDQGGGGGTAAPEGVSPAAPAEPAAATSLAEMLK